MARRTLTGKDTQQEETNVYRWKGSGSQWEQKGNESKKHIDQKKREMLERKVRP